MRFHKVMDSFLGASNRSYLMEHLLMFCFLEDGAKFFWCNHFSLFLSKCLRILVPLVRVTVSVFSKWRLHCVIALHELIAGYTCYNCYCIDISRSVLYSGSVICIVQIPTAISTHPTFARLCSLTQRVHYCTTKKFRRKWSDTRTAKAHLFVITTRWITFCVTTGRSAPHWHSCCTGWGVFLSNLAYFQPSCLTIGHLFCLHHLLLFDVCNLWTISSK